ncbi:hypothetical protein Plhal304r1_c059g0147421 [Plasmopara halstedii]
MQEELNDPEIPQVFIAAAFLPQTHQSRLSSAATIRHEGCSLLSQSQTFVLAIFIRTSSQNYVWGDRAIKQM